MIKAVPNVIACRSYRVRWEITSGWEESWRCVNEIHILSNRASRRVLEFETLLHHFGWENTK